MKRCVMGLMMLAVVARMVSADDKPDAEVKKLEGTWVIEALDIAGRKIDAPKDKGGCFVFAKDMKLTIKDAGKPDKPGHYKIDAGKSPKEIDLIQSKDGKPGERMQAIYEVEGDRLTLAFSAAGPKGKRPSAFKGEKVAIMHLKRQKS